LPGDARPSLWMQRIGRFAGDRDQSWPSRVPVLPVAAARSSQLPAGTLDTPDRLLDLDGHAWTVGSRADGPGVRRATASATSRLAPSRHLTDRRRSALAKPQQAIALRRFANAQLPARVVFRPPLPIASRRLRHAWAYLTRCLRQVERGAKSESEARRRPGDLLRPSARDHHLETTHPSARLHTPVARVRALLSGRAPVQRRLGTPCALNLATDGFLSRRRV
jgi:hypothetical protein